MFMKKQQKLVTILVCLLKINMQYSIASIIQIVYYITLLKQSVNKIHGTLYWNTIKPPLLFEDSKFHAQQAYSESAYFITLENFCIYGIQHGTKPTSKMGLLVYVTP